MLLGAGLVALLIPLALAYWDDLRRERERGITSDLAFLLTYVAGAVTGLTDVDAITLSMACLAKEGLAHEVAATTILIACGANTLVKGLLAFSLGGWAFGRRVFLAFFLMLSCGAAGALALWTRA